MKGDKMRKFQDLIGRRFGRLTVIKLHEKKQQYKNGKKSGFEYYYLCKCDCGNEKIIRSYALTENMTQSCGCLHKEMVSTKTREKIITMPDKTKYDLTNIEDFYNYLTFQFDKVKKIK